MMDQLTKEERLQLAQKGLENPVWFCEFFLHRWFKEPMPWVHRGLLAIMLNRCSFLIDDPELDKIIRNFTYKQNEKVIPIFTLLDTAGGPKLTMHRGRYVMVLMPRGFSKTTIELAVLVMKVVYQTLGVGVYISEAAPHAEQQLANIKMELELNERLLSVFGPQRPPLKSSYKWAADMVQTSSGQTLIARGRGGQVRGINIGGVRPRSIVGDDLEDQESVSTTMQCQKTSDWFYGAVVPAQDESDKDFTLTLLATLLGADCLVVRLMKNPAWIIIQFGAHDCDGALLWPYKMNESQLAAQKEGYISDGKLDVFYREYYNRIVAPELQKFKAESFIYDKPAVDETLRNAVYLDPAISNEPGADYACIAVVGMSSKGRIFVHEMWGKRGASPSELIDVFFQLSKAYDCLKHGVESVAYQASLIVTMREDMFRKKHYFEIEPVRNVKKKSERIEAILVKRFNNGYITFTKRFPLLEQQLLDWQRTTKVKDDYPDALAGAIALLDPFAADASEGDLGADEMEPLEQEYFAGAV